MEEIYDFQNGFRPPPQEQNKSRLKQIPENTQKK